MREIIVELNLNENGEIIPIFPNNFNFKNKMKQIQRFYVNVELKKIAYSEQSPKNSLNAYKNGQKNGSPSIRTKEMHEAIKQELNKGNNVKVVIEQVIGDKTPKELADEEIEKYKKEHNGIAPEWNKQKNHKKWKDNENKSS
ncbi:hypothetical protein ACSSA8_001594 [Campylobacter lari]|uniref:hypothetical protein n=2 Tax=Campylobacter lari TaxID=201 RepID=UPI002149A363|nr:hypothetical protein [Campylobacter lari]EHH9692261.1 hypothetical protein [Campylobacter lari]MCR2058104.1 hypothetical protein [Campylobacter lari subsp. concheus]